VRTQHIAVKDDSRGECRGQERSAHVKLGQFSMSVDARGGKVRKVVPSCLGRNILSEPRVPFAIAGVRGCNFEVAGWDEACPTVAESAGMPGLGWAWQVPAETVQEPDSLRTVWQLPGLMVERTLTAVELAMTASYRFENTGPDVTPFLWASHALYTVEGLLELDMPGEGFVAGPSCLLPEVETQVECGGGRARISNFSDLARSWKFFVPAGAPVSLLFTDATLHITTTAPWFGVFLNKGNFGQPCVGIEPTTHATDYAGDAGTLFSGETKELSWSLEVISKSSP